MQSVKKPGLLAVILFSFAAQAQTADEIINKYIANTLVRVRHPTAGGSMAR